MRFGQSLKTSEKMNQCLNINNSYLIVRNGSCNNEYLKGIHRIRDYSTRVRH